MVSPKLRYADLNSKALFCPRRCESHPPEGRRSRHFVRHGFFYRSSDRAWVSRFYCYGCQRTFSRATHHPCFGQKKRTVNFPLFRLLCSAMTGRRAARHLKISRKTVDRKIQFLGEQAALEQERFLKESSREKRYGKIQFDELETFEHTKGKPLSIPLVVESRTRLILGVDVCSMPAKGPLAEISRRKYGVRANDRIPTLRALLQRLTPYVDPKAEFRSDSHPYYPPVLKGVFPESTHRRVESRKGAITGQGELKKVRWDPIFSLNHTAAMYRANVSRLVRKTWATTKKKDRLRHHLLIYAVWHNRVILERWERRRRKERGTTLRVERRRGNANLALAA